MNPKCLVGAVIFCLLITACSNNYHKFVSNYTFLSEKGAPDYTSLDYWAAHPYKRDPSDSVPQPLLAGYHPDSTIDVFFIYPTTYTDMRRPLGWNAPIDNAELNAKTDYTSILFQASIFNEAGRIFSPRYRQANLSCYFPKTADDSVHAKAAFELAYNDIRTAFIYYLQNNNKGRPIIIASHSQGTTHAERLLKEFFDDQPLQKQLVAAYIIGMPIDTGYFKNLKACSTSSQTGCVVSWRTFKKDYIPDYVQTENFTAIVTNPLTWDAGMPNAGRSLNKGGVLLSFNKVVKKVADANINGNVLWIDKPHFFGNIFYTSKNFHVADLNLYYINIRENVATRVNAFLKK